jgi:hypothetical protein
MEFTNKWNLWFHYDKNNWSIDGFKNIYTITNSETFWKLYNNWDTIGGILGKHYFLMKDNIKPIWEDENNINGGCWSFKILNNVAYEIWEELSILLVCNELLQNKDDCIGLSISIKKNNYSVIKIWNKNSYNNSINNINPIILEKWGTDILYISHKPQN